MKSAREKERGSNKYVNSPSNILDWIFLFIYYLRLLEFCGRGRRICRQPQTSWTSCMGGLNEAVANAAVVQTTPLPPSASFRSLSDWPRQRIRLSHDRSLFERGVKRGGLLLRHMFYRPTLGIEREGEKAATVTTPTDRADRALFPFLLYPTFGLSSFPPFVFARIVRREVERGRKWGIFPLSGLMFFILFF